MKERMENMDTDVEVQRFNPKRSICLGSVQALPFNLHWGLHSKERTEILFSRLNIVDFMKKTFVEF